MQVGDAQRGKAERPAQVSHVLQVDGDRRARSGGGRAAPTGDWFIVEQLRALGIGRGSYQPSARGGRAGTASFPAVLSVVHPVLEPWAIETAALLYAGDDAVLSHESAAAVWGLDHLARLRGHHDDRSQGTSTATAAASTRSRRLDIRDIRIHAGLPGDRPGPDAHRLRRHRAPRRPDCSTRPGCCTLINEMPTCTAAIERVPGATGSGAAARAPGGRAGLAGFTRSEAERRLKRLLRRGRGPAAARGQRAASAAMRSTPTGPSTRWCVEVDGFASTATGRRSSTTAPSDQMLVAAGLSSCIRITWRQLDADADRWSPPRLARTGPAQTGRPERPARHPTVAAGMLRSAMRYWDAVFCLPRRDGDRGGADAARGAPGPAHGRGRSRASGGWRTRRRRCWAGWRSWPGCWWPRRSGCRRRSSCRTSPHGRPGSGGTVDTVGGDRRRVPDHARRRDRRRARPAPPVKLARPDRRGRDRGARAGRW